MNLPNDSEPGQNWVDPEGVDSRGWTRSHRETDAAGPEGLKRTAYGTDFSNPGGQYEYQEWNGQRDPLGKVDAGQWHDQNDYEVSSPDIRAQSNRPQDKHVNAQTQQSASLSQQQNNRATLNEATENMSEIAGDVQEKYAKLAEPDASVPGHPDPRV